MKKYAFCPRLKGILLCPSLENKRGRKKERNIFLSFFFFLFFVLDRAPFGLNSLSHWFIGTNHFYSFSFSSFSFCSFSLFLFFSCSLAFFFLSCNYTPRQQKKSSCFTKISHFFDKTPLSVSLNMSERNKKGSKEHEKQRKIETERKKKSKRKICIFWKFSVHFNKYFIQF